ncbi:hypothetical protein F2Q69_00017157 [Brassica cretica]|uniref:Leucine-rich repeat-containing N-terminal plant-type domain-containing protein n=1 Tax=Brassica cretica TaxID=69181 RepID=A0A8S9QWH8_BRACR|nr:hypothetical protein F2Q69_00017157 [Brassica cretica]
MSESRLRLHFLLLILLCYISPSTSFFSFKYDDSSYVACHPNQTQALTEFMNEFDSSHCNLSDPDNGVWCDKSTGAVTMLRLQTCLSGTLKPNSSLFRLQHLRHLVLDQNNFISSSLPSEFGNLNSLNTVLLSDNLFNGFEGPVDVLVNSSMKNLGIAVNCFEGEIPFLPLSINFFEASYNRFTGSIPLSICNYRSLTQLKLGYNNLTGPIPQCLSHNLTNLFLRKNNLEGSIPDAFYKSASLRSLDIGHNRLTGKIPRSLRNCSSLEFLVADHNRIEDKFPFWLKALPNLQVLILSSNKLYGSLSPPGQGPLGFPELHIFEISDNKFTGSLPPTYFVNWKASPATMNEYGDLSSNQLSGTIPNGLGSLSFLEYINVSHNQLKGEIPQGTQITGQAKSSFEGNAGLCGLPLQETCFGTIAPPTQPPKQEDEEEEVEVLNWKGVVIGYGVGLLLGLAIAHVIGSYKPEWLVQIVGPNKRRSR